MYKLENIFGIYVNFYVVAPNYRQNIYFSAKLLLPLHAFRERAKDRRTASGDHDLLCIPDTSHLLADLLCTLWTSCDPAASMTLFTVGRKNEDGVYVPISGETDCQEM